MNTYNFEMSQEELSRMFKQMNKQMKEVKDPKTSNNVVESDYIFNKDESNAILVYTQETPPAINELLRGNKVKVYKGDIKKYITMINSFSKIPLSDDESVVYRGLDLSRIIIDNNEFVIDNLISTTDEPHVAMKFAGEKVGKTILKITLPANIPILNIGLLSPTYTRFILDAGEESILLPGKFTITDVKMENGINLIECRYSQYRDVTSTLNLLSDRIIDIVEE